MHPTSPPAAPPRQAPSPANLKKQRAAQGPQAPAGPAKPNGPAVKLTPEQQVQKAAEDAETKRKEQEKIVAINDEWKAKLTDEEKDEVLRVVARRDPQLVVNHTIQPCLKEKKPKNLACAPASPALQTPHVSEEVKAAVVKSQETKRGESGTMKIDYDKVTTWEGGSYSGGYVPWGPVIKPVTKDIGEKGHPHPVTIFVPDTAHSIPSGQTKTALTGWPGNNSGVTIGAGVDMGAKDEKQYREGLRKAANSSGLLTEPEAGQLSDKLKPYIGLKRTDACQALHKAPLTLSQKEVDLLNYESLMSHTDDARRQYEDATGKQWSDLSQEEQTLVFSHAYHHGHIGRDMAKDISGYEREKVINQLDAHTIMKNGIPKQVPAERELGYMKDFYKREAAAGTPRAKAAAIREATRG